MNETEFAYRVRQALDEGLEHVDYKVALRLEKARRAALDRSSAGEAVPARAPALRLASAGGPDLDERPALVQWALRAGVLVPIIALALGIVGIKQWQMDRTVNEIADLDFAVLLDDTPIDTYAHQGFGVYLRDEQNGD
jgi:hypothetical protein